MPHFMLNALFLLNKKSFFVRFSFKKLLCSLYRGDFMRIWPKNGRVQIFCPLYFSQLSALEHVHFRQVLVYVYTCKLLVELKQ